MLSTDNILQKYRYPPQCKSFTCRLFTWLHSWYSFPPLRGHMNWRRLFLIWDCFSSVPFNNIFPGLFWCMLLVPAIPNYLSMFFNENICNCVGSRYLVSNSLSELHYTLKGYRQGKKCGPVSSCTAFRRHHLTTLVENLWSVVLDYYAYCFSVTLVLKSFILQLKFNSLIILSTWVPANVVDVQL